MSNEEKTIWAGFKIAMPVFTIVVLAILGSCSMETVETGNRGAKVTFGKVSDKVLIEGLYFVNPFTTHVEQLSIRSNKWNANTEAYTKDVQRSKMAFTMTYHLEPSSVPRVIATVGEDWANKFIGQVVVEEIKRETGQHIAVDIVNKRDLAARTIETNVRKILAKRDVIVEGFSLTNIDFDPAFEQAVEAKVINQQNALGEINKTVQIQEIAKQQVETAQGNAKATILNAEAEARAIEVKAKALAQSQSVLELEAIKKWDGTLPVWITSGSASPFINIKPKGSE